ncbi:uncharacterized protein LOC132552633 [Ylistrum balloti]|uniref:uncharacterized protein LOC132552633 n=1 Tax=Ylistrum balloti TaxID=509963 RepID=UPI002905EE1E|nr:uncharacterized protein LOC132552633 [Ylistrum balloti]
MADQERTSLLKTQTRQPSSLPHCKVALAVVLLGVVVIFILVGVHTADLMSGAVTSGTGALSAKSPTLQHIDPFSHSFQAKLKLLKQPEAGTENTNTWIDVHWNSDTHTFTYQETRTSNSSSSVHVDQVITRFIYAKHSAVLGVIYGKEEQWFCQNDIESVKWLMVIEIVLQKQAMLYTNGTGVNNPSCSGNKLYTTAAGQTIDLCIHGSQLVYIGHQGTRAIVTEWKTGSSNMIILPQKLEECNVTFPDISHLEEMSAATENFIPKSRPSLLNRKPKKHCLFVHGAGEHPPTDTYLDKKTLPSYWGHIEQYTPQCLTRRFMWYNSIERGWDDIQSHEMFCEFALGNSTRPISNTVIYSHSMGNLVVAAAFHRRICKFDHRTSIWYSIQAPWRGSKVSDELQYLCSRKDLKTKVTYLVLEELNYCKPKSDRPSQAYVSLKTSYQSPTGVSYNDLIRTARRLISGAVCGTSAFGMDLSFSMSARLHLVSAFTQLSLPNDGLVAFDSCEIKGNFDIKPTSHYYRGHFNHAEGTCRFGESHTFMRPQQHPCLWYDK